MTSRVLKENKTRRGETTENRNLAFVLMVILGEVQGLLKGVKKMQKLLTPLATVLILCSILLGCAPEEGIAIPTTPWPDKEQTRYTVEEQAGNTIGSGTLTIARKGESYILGQYWKLGDIKQTVSIEVASDDLKPVSGNQTIVSPRGEVKINTTYTGNKLSIEAETPQGPRTAEIDVPDDAYDNDEVLFLFRTLPFEEGYQATYTIIVASTAQKPKVTITIIGKEQIEAPAGLFHCWKLELKVAEQKQYVWYSIDDPHHLVKYDDGQNTILLQEIVQ